MKMETERLFIRRFQRTDWKDLYDYLSDPGVVKYEPYGTFSIRESKLEARLRAKSAAFLAVCLKGEGKMIGNLYFNRSMPKETMAWELGYIFNTHYQKKGYATEAAAWMLDYGFETYGAHRITARCNPLNESSWRLLERIGMRREAHFMKNLFFRRDAKGKPLWQDTYEYALLREEWIRSKTQRREEAIEIG